MTSLFLRMACAGTLALVAGCATSDRFSADVTRFHLNQQMARGSVFIEPPVADAAAAGGLEFQTYARAVAEELRAAGFQPVDTLAAAELVAVLDYGQTSREGLPQSSPFRIGIGGGSVGGHVGVGVGTSIGIGKPKSRDILVNSLALRLKRKSDNSVVWEGRALSEANEGSANASLSAAIPLLAKAVLADFPGASGKTVRYPAR